MKTCRPSTRSLIVGITSIACAFGSVVDSAEEAAGKPVPDFEQLSVQIGPPGIHHFSQSEQLSIDRSGRCAYKVEARPALNRAGARNPAYFRHQLPPADILRFNKLLRKTGWLTAEGAEGPPTHSDAATVKITLIRGVEKRSVVCQGQRPEPYESLLHAIHGLATQERRIYLHDFVGGQDGIDAWETVGRGVASFRGDPTGKPPYQIDYTRYLPIAVRFTRQHYGKSDAELITAVRLVGHFKLEAELPFLHRMAHDRSSSNLRAEVAWALGEIHDERSLPILASMMAAPASRDSSGLELVTWGESAIPHIVELIGFSTDETRPSSENLLGEDMIRTYLDHWDQLETPINPVVVSAVKKALEEKNPSNGLIRTTYHKEFLGKVR